MKNDVVTYKGKWFYGYKESSPVRGVKKEVKTIICKLMGFPLQVLDFMLDWVYRGVYKFPVCLAVCDAFEYKPCLFFKLHDPFFISENLCIHYFVFQDAVEVLEKYDLVIYRRVYSEDSASIDYRVFLNIEKIIYLLSPAQTNDSKIFTEILEEYLRVCEKMKSENEYKKYEAYGQYFPSRSYWLDNPISLESY